MSDNDAIWSALADSPVSLDAALQRIFEWDCEDLDVESGYWRAIARLLSAAPRMQARILELESIVARQNEKSALPTVARTPLRNAARVAPETSARTGRIRWVRRVRRST